MAGVAVGQASASVVEGEGEEGRGVPVFCGNSHGGLESCDMPVGRAVGQASASAVEGEEGRGVPAGCVGRLPRPAEFGSVEEFSAAIVEALDAQSRRQHGEGVGGAIAVVPYSEMPRTLFWETFARQGKPVVLTGAGQAMGYDLDAWSVSGLAARFPNYPLTVRTANGEDYDTISSVDMTLQQYLDGGDEEDSSSFYGANNFVHPDLVSSIVLPDLGYPEHVYRLMDTRLWIARNPGPGAALHQDLQDNFVLMMGGKKTFFLRPPHVVEKSRAWSVTPFLRSGGGGGCIGSTDEEKEDVVAQVDLLPGDLLYLPAGWWHATFCESPSTISINFFMSACFAALGVIVPKIAEPDWLCDDDGENRRAPQIHVRNVRNYL